MVDIYFIQQDIRLGKIKIGYSKNVELRFVGIQSGSPETLKLLFTIPNRWWATEQWLHRLFEGSHYRGEWFTPVGLLALFLDHPWCLTRDAIHETPETAARIMTDTFIACKSPVLYRSREKQIFEFPHRFAGMFGINDYPKRSFVESKLAKLQYRTLYV